MISFKVFKVIYMTALYLDLRCGQFSELNARCMSVLSKLERKYIIMVSLLSMYLEGILGFLVLNFSCDYR